MGIIFANTVRNDELARMKIKYEVKTMSKKDEHFYMDDTDPRFRVCPICKTAYGSEICTVKLEDSNAWEYEEPQYCPHCGLKMGVKTT
jgi:hypothetical protein